MTEEDAQELAELLISLFLRPECRVRIEQTKGGNWKVKIRRNGTEKPILAVYRGKQLLSEGWEK